MQGPRLRGGSRPSVVKLAALALALLAASHASFFARALAQAGGWYAVDENKGLVNVETDFFNVTLDLSKGGGLTSATLLYGGVEANPLQAAGCLPSLFIYAYSNTSSNAPGASMINVTCGGKTSAVSYPGLLALKPWRASVVYADDETLLLRLEPGPEASVDIEPIKLTVEARFYRHLPVIDYTITFTNPASEPVELYSLELAGSRWGPIVELVAGDESPESWNLTVLYTLESGGARLESSSKSGYLVSFANASRVDAVALLKSQPTPRYLVAVEPYTKPALAELVKGYADLSSEAVRARLIYPLAVLQPGESYVISFRVALAWWDPGSLSLAGLGGLYCKLGDPTRLKSVFEHESTIENLTRQLSSLREQLNETKARLEEAEKRAEDAEKRAGELKGLLSKCMADYNYTKARLEAANAKVKRAGAQAVAALLAGVVLGLAGYRYAIQPLLEASVRRRRLR
ncbi:hypothetical protein [Stetteria hydrogenophila]